MTVRSPAKRGWKKKSGRAIPGTKSDELLSFQLCTARDFVRFFSLHLFWRVRCGKISAFICDDLPVPLPVLNAIWFNFLVSFIAWPPRDAGKFARSGPDWARSRTDPIHHPLLNRETTRGLRAAGFQRASRCGGVDSLFLGSVRRGHSSRQQISTDAGLTRRLPKPSCLMWAGFANPPCC